MAKLALVTSTEPSGSTHPATGHHGVSVHVEAGHPVSDPFHHVTSIVAIGGCREEDRAKRSLGFVLVATVDGPPRSPHQTCRAPAARNDRRPHPAATTSISSVRGWPPGHGSFWSNRTLVTSSGWRRLHHGVRIIKSVVSAVSAIDESAVDPDRLHPRRRGRGGRVHPQGRRSSCGAPASRSARPPCGPSGATSPSSPISRAMPSRSMLSIVNMPVLSSPSGTSKKGPDYSSTCPRGASSPTRPGCSALCSRDDLIRWTAMLGELTPTDHLTVARTGSHGSSLFRAAWSAVPACRRCARSSRVAMGRGLPSRPQPLAKLATCPRLGNLARVAHRKSGHQALTSMCIS